MLINNFRSTHHRCVPCSRQFSGKSVLYRLHIKNKHGSVEPEVNLNPPTPATPVTQVSKYRHKMGRPKKVSSIFSEYK